MLTIFDLLQGVGAFGGALFAGRFGYDSFGWPTAVVATPLGFVAGAYIGNLPWAAAGAWMRYDLKRSSNDKLKERLEAEYFVAHLLIAELVSRGEPLEQFRSYVGALLHSDDSSRHHFGEQTARIWFPDLLPSSTVAATNNPQ
jgi:hypothetical protein